MEVLTAAQMYQLLGCDMQVTCVLGKPSALARDCLEFMIQDLVLNLAPTKEIPSLDVDKVRRYSWHEIKHTSHSQDDPDEFLVKTL